MKLARILVAAAVAVPSFAALTTVALAVSGLNCCPIAVIKASTGVDDVTKARLSFDTRTASVKFDDARTTTDALTKATVASGHPSQVRN